MSWENSLNIQKVYNIPMRTIELHDKKVEKALAEKARLIEAGREISQQIEDLQTEQNKIGLKVQKIKDDIVLPFAKELKKTLGKYEDLETLKLVHGKIVVEVFDYIERYKTRLVSFVRLRS